MADALSIEAQNKVRASLGLSLLPVPGNAGVTTSRDTDSSESEEEEEVGSTLESRQAEGYENWTQLQKQAAEKKKRQARLDAMSESADPDESGSSGGPRTSIAHATHAQERHPRPCDRARSKSLPPL